MTVEPTSNFTSQVFVEAPEQPSERILRFSTPPRWLPSAVPRRGSLLSTHTIKTDIPFTLRESYTHLPIAREWSSPRKRLTAAVACLNTVLIGFVVGVYAGEVPRIQYTLADQAHSIIQGNIYLYAGMAVTNFIFWPLPLLHGRKVYNLLALAVVLPLQFPQAAILSADRSRRIFMFQNVMLVCRLLTGLALGFLNINCFATLLDLFGASLQSSRPHQELVIIQDLRRVGGGMGLWLGIWSWCFGGSIAVGFLVGAVIISTSDPDWGIYVAVLLTVVVLLANVVAPDTRSSAYRRSIKEISDEKGLKLKVARGEIKLHIGMEGPSHWWEEVLAGLTLSAGMMSQFGMSILAVYLGWIYAQIVLIITLLGALLSRVYGLASPTVGLGVFFIAVGAFLSLPLTKANIFSRSRKRGPRTDSMTFTTQISWSSHMVRRIIFTITLPIASLGYTLLSHGVPLHYYAPIVLAGVIGFLSTLAIAECNGLIMEAFDTSDLQPGVNSRHRLQSLVADVKVRRTDFSSFPRVTAGIMCAQTIGFLLAAAATGVGGAMTRTVGAQISTGITAGCLLFVTLCLIAVLWRSKEVQVIPDVAFGERRDSKAWKDVEEWWKPVIIGCPSGKVRRMNVLEKGRWARWGEIRRLNWLKDAEG